MIVKSTSDYAALKEELIAYAHEIGIQKIGFTTADPFLFLKERLLEAEALDLFTGF
ncbi:epoxyqueuosine reductase, partial [Enterococcus faecium]